MYASGAPGKILNNNTEEKDARQQAGGSGTARGWVGGWIDKQKMARAGRRSWLWKKQASPFSSLPKLIALKTFKSKATN